MPRASQLLHPPFTPVPAVPAASLVWLRDGPQGLETLLSRRAPNASFAPGAYVFAGGRIDAEDATAPARHRPAQDATARAATVAALRESFEELGLLLAHHADGTPCTPAEAQTLSRHIPLLPQLAARGWRLAADALHPLARWITDRDWPRRFDTHFFIARAPEGQTPVADGSEQFDPQWLRPADALARHQAGQLHLIYPTLRTLEHLTRYDSVQAALQACAASEQPLWTSCTRGGYFQGRAACYMEHEPPFGELDLVCPDGQVLHPLDWQHTQARPLLKNLLRLTAPNPGVMTGPGTNSYLVGDAHTGYIAIDPGPADDSHVQRLWQASGGDVRAIVCTHSHADHAPGAWLLQALCAHAPHGRPPVLGLPSAPTASANSHFRPDRALRHGETLHLSPPDGDPARSHSLQVLHTPGHAANHLCLLLLQDGLLFSGDHILSGTTTVINPPDGDMSAYLDALDMLHTLCQQHGVQHILPAHGHAMHDACAHITRLKAHRLAREAKVQAAMQALPHGSPEDWTALAYADTPKALWPVAKRSLLAHVQRLQALAQPGKPQPAPQRET